MAAKRMAITGLVVTVLAVLALGCQTTASRGDVPTNVSTDVPSDVASDSTAVLQAKFDAMKPGDTLKLDARTYSHSGVLFLRVPNVRIDGAGATLSATDDATSSVQILADAVQLSNVLLTAPQQGPRMTGLNQHKLVIGGSGDTVSNVQVDGSAAAGIFVDGARDFAIRDVEVENTRADGIHMTRGAGPGVVDRVRTSQTGDDAVAVVSYRGEQPTHDITISGVDVASTRWGRGISVVGGTNVTVHDFTVARTNAAGVYIATEGSPYFTLSVSDVTVRNGSIREANQNSDIVHGAILVSAANQGTSIDDVTISDVDVSATTPSAGRNVAVLTDGGGSVDRIAIDGIHLDGDALSPFSTDAPPDSLRLSGWTVAGKPVSVN